MTFGLSLSGRSALSSSTFKIPASTGNFKFQFDLSGLWPTALCACDLLSMTKPLTKLSFTAVELLV